MTSIEDEIKQSTFGSASHKAQVNVVYTSLWLNQQTSRILKPFGISTQQFNILRILRGRGAKPSTVKLLTERMLDKMSNASRLVDKLKEKGLVDRQTCADDRRRVDILITPAGLELINQASRAVDAYRDTHLNHLSKAEAQQLSDLLDKFRG